MTNKTYDILKWIFSVAMPAITTFWLAIAGIWGIPYAEPIGATLTAITALGCTLLGISSIKYNKKKELENS